LGRDSVKACKIFPGAKRTSWREHTNPRLFFSDRPRALALSLCHGFYGDTFWEKRYSRYVATTVVSSLAKFTEDRRSDILFEDVAKVSVWSNGHTSRNAPTATESSNVFGGSNNHRYNCCLRSWPHRRGAPSGVTGDGEGIGQRRKPSPTKLCSVAVLNHPRRLDAKSFAT